jgi:16S rRNA (guanine966-N2)-methyltransferase
VEQDRAALEALESNIAKLGAGSQSEVRRGSALMLGPARKPFDLILMDPPYGTGAGSVALDKLARLGWIAPGALISIETGNREDTEVKGFEIDTIRDIGKARITLLRPESTVE